MGFIFPQGEIKLFVWSLVVVSCETARAWCQHYDKSKAQLILETEAGA